eukprot:COSAG06_NODE_1987_length_7906_cov_36.391315_10_plen_141_part_00
MKAHIRSAMLEESRLQNVREQVAARKAAQKEAERTAAAERARQQAEAEQREREAARKRLEELAAQQLEQQQREAAAGAVEDEEAAAAPYKMTAEDEACFEHIWRWVSAGNSTVGGNTGTARERNQQGLNRQQLQVCQNNR